MPNILTIMDISRWALNTATKQLDTVSHNVSNANNASYSRQEVVVATMFPEKTGAGYYGLGSRAQTVIQCVDKLLLRRISDKTSDLSYQESRLTQLLRLESLSNEATSYSLGTLTSAFFAAWQNVSNNPESTAVREDLLETASTLTSRLQTLSYDLNVLKRDLDSYLDHAVTEVNSISRRIAELNDLIVMGETSGHTANDFRDERVALINELASRLNIQWFEDANGAVTITAGNGKTLVHASYPRKTDDDPLQFTYPPGSNGVGDKQITWQGTEVVLEAREITGGEIGAWLQVRDVDIPQTLEILEEFTRTIIGAVNVIHSNGVGLDKFSVLNGSYQTQNIKTAFNDSNQDMAFADLVQDGQVSFWVYQNGMQHKYTINVSPNDSMQSVVDRINQAMHPNWPTVDTSQSPAAYLREENGFYTFHMSSAPNSGIEFAFESDTSGFLAAAGINTFFTGDSMANIGINDALKSNVRNIAAGRLLSTGEHALGDNSNALMLGNLKDANIMGGGTQTLNESLIQWAAQLGTKIASTRDKYGFAEIATNELLTQRDNISAVNTDEELIKLIQFQRAYQAAAKMVSVADTLLETILSLKQ